MSDENLWGELPSGNEFKPPLTILREQATLLSDITNKILVADVRVKRQGTSISFSLRIVAPALDNYTYVVLSVTHDLFMYPVEVTNLTLMTQKGPPTYTCNDEDAYKSVLKAVLSSQPVHRVISSLIAQSKSPE